MKRKYEILIAIILIIISIIAVILYILGYKITPSEVYEADNFNLVPVGSFEDFKGGAMDCCGVSGAKVNASKSLEHFEGKYSLNLTANGGCACVSNPIIGLNSSEIYFLSFNYKGEHSKVCVYAVDKRKCIIDQVITSNSWETYNNVIIPLANYSNMAIFFYAFSSGNQSATSLYDNLKVYHLINLGNSSISKFNYMPDQEYIIKTDPANIVNNPGAEKLNDDGYYLVKGEPNITLQFPWTELVLLLIVMVIVIRLLFKKPVIHIQEEGREEVDSIVGKVKRK